MINLEKTLLDRQPALRDKAWAKYAFKVLKKLIREDEINYFIKTNQHLRGFAFLDKVLEYFNFSYQVSDKSINNIPAEGRLIIIANHPIGSLDGLALLKLVHSVRPDSRIVANELLTLLEPLESLFLPVEVLSGRASYKSQFQAMLDALENEQALIIFPAGEVSRINAAGIRDGVWKQGFVKLAKKTQAPILPIFIDAKNSTLFYSLSTLYKPLGTLLLVHEMFNKENQKLTFHVGKAIPAREIEQSELPPKLLANRFKKHLYRLAKKSPKKNKKPKKILFNTIETVAHPARRQFLKRELYAAKLLGETEDGKKIFLYDYSPDSAVMHEIGRLRELTFRTVEEGTGSALDIDSYDVYYRHLVLWDEHDLEIIGAYRLGECKKIVQDKGIAGLYTSTLFDLHPSIQNRLPETIELGRSFVQPRYWGKRSLDYLWFGIGAYLRAHPNIKYLFGPVSLSQAYPQSSKEIIIAFYNKQFGSHEQMASAKIPFEISSKAQQLANNEFADDYKNSYRQLNSQLKTLGVKVPTLYKQYTELCETGGCQFIAFNIDPAFNYCIDSLILVDLDKIKPRKKERYIGSLATTMPCHTEHHKSDNKNSQYCKLGVMSV